MTPLHEGSTVIADRPVALADTGVAAGSVTAPAANAAVATIASPGVGIYRIMVHLRMSGTAETLPTNLELRHGATVVGKAAITSITDPQKIEFARVTVANGEAITANATATATAGAIYNCLITCTRIG